MTDVQNRILSIFKEVAKVCEANGIPHYAIGGTCIGAVRHKGFIPWDDDIDIAIPIEHYDSFAKIARRQLPSNLYLLTAEDVVHYHYVWYKVCDENTTFIEASEYRYKDAYKGVFIDIMPIAGIPEEPKEQSAFIRKLSKLSWLNNVRRFPVIASNSLNIILKSLVKLWTLLFPYNYYSNKYLALLKKYPFSSSYKTGYTWHPSWLPRLVFPTVWFSAGVKMDFEDTKISCPTKWNLYLEKQFGDYMKLPPDNERQIHNGFVDLNNSYQKYQSKGLPL